MPRFPLHVLLVAGREGHLESEPRCIGGEPAERRLCGHTCLGIRAAIGRADREIDHIAGRMLAMPRRGGRDRPIRAVRAFARPTECALLALQGTVTGKCPKPPLNRRIIRRGRQQSLKIGRSLGPKPALAKGEAWPYRDQHVGGCIPIREMTKRTAIRFDRYVGAIAQLRFSRRGDDKKDES